MLPQVVADRRTKGGPQGFSFQIFWKFREEIKERLLSGYLVRNKIVDKVAIEASFDSGVQLPAAVIGRLLMLVDAEAWVQQWRSTRLNLGHDKAD
jgi:asparagine synthase (glutamine-hydrolysing)